MDATTRLAAIEARCEVLGWNFHLDDSCDNPRYEIEGHAAEWQLSGYGDLDVDLTAAERLLSCYEPGPVVKVADACKACQLWSPHEWGPHPGDCALDAGTPDDSEARIDYQNMLPGPLCPGAGTYKLTPVEVDDA